MSLLYRPADWVQPQIFSASPISQASASQSVKEYELAHRALNVPHKKNIRCTKKRKNHKKKCQFVKVLHEIAARKANILNVLLH